jgi:hypothetical protein
VGGTIACSIVPPGLFNFRSRIPALCSARAGLSTIAPPFVPQGEPALRARKHWQDAFGCGHRKYLRFAVAGRASLSSGAKAHFILPAYVGAGSSDLLKCSFLPRSSQKGTRNVRKERVHSSLRDFAIFVPVSRHSASRRAGLTTIAPPALRARKHWQDVFGCGHRKCLHFAVAGRALLSSGAKAQFILLAYVGAEAPTS